MTHHFLLGKTNAKPYLHSLCHRCDSPEFWCPKLKPARCSQYGKCISLEFLETARGDLVVDTSLSNKNTSRSTATISKLLPQITLLGSGTVAFLSTGGTAMLHTVPYMSL